VHGGLGALAGAVPYLLAGAPLAFVGLVVALFLAAGYLSGAYYWEWSEKQFAAAHQEDGVEQTRCT
jgi:hypothetical protein